MRGLLITSQILVLLLSLGARLLGFGLFTFILIVTPIGWACAAVVLALLVTVAIMATARGQVRLRSATLSLLAAADAAMLVFALCAVDYGDINDSSKAHMVPLHTLVTGDEHVSGTTETVYLAVEAVSLVAFLLTFVAAFAFAIAGRPAAEAGSRRPR
ncbi:hypothetical protein [Nocardia huaxiensis]|uniref:hypothetical protein n=1 Tax=Nocardia huaxiensis TaxID=2755382 RepID=UPI001E2A1D4D|nr:hypothetical protein [Nocardia huaxiensis]UFS96335.1 hypothetical protein LPY97_37865 [Nocardia huaxiensis]